MCDIGSLIILQEAKDYKKQITWLQGSLKDIPHDTYLNTEF